jgi:hypothetical protein
MLHFAGTPNCTASNLANPFTRRPYLRRPILALWISLIFLVAEGICVPQVISAQIAFVQVNKAVPQTPQTTVQVTYAAAQTAGNLNVVVVGWNDTTATVTSVTDTQLNQYVLAAGPTQLNGKISQSIYYAKNIVNAGAGANVVTVTFSQGAAYPDIRILEYSGIDTANPLDVSVGTALSSATSSTAPVTSSNAADLLVGANTVATYTSGPGANFTNRVITSPDGDIVEDQVVTATGSYSASAPLTVAGGWVMQMVAFRAGSPPPPPPPPPPNTIKFVQVNAVTPQTPQTSVTVPYKTAQKPRDLNVVIVGWNDTTATVSSVTDTAGNTYTKAVGPTQIGGVLSQSIYYAQNLPLGNNSVIVTFSQAAAYPDIRVLEYAGIDTNNPIDLTAALSGNSGSSSTNAVTTTNATDLLLGANIVSTLTKGAGANFTNRVITAPDGDIVEDRVVAPGSYSASAPLTAAGSWVMQMVALRAASTQPDTTPPTVNVTPPAPPLTGTINVTVSASDTGTGVASIQLQVDGVTIGAGASTSPATFKLDTTKFDNTTHSLTGVATDFANNTGVSSPVSVTFSNSNPGKPAQSGVWSNVVPLPVVAVHTALLPNGSVFMSDGMGYGANAIDWHYINNIIDTVTAPQNIFCNGMDQMADGRLMIVGGHQAGHVGLNFAGIFDPGTESWTVLPNMAYPRWYPTLTSLSDSRLMVTSGEMNGSGTDQPIPEIYNPSTNSWSQLSNSQLPFVPVPYYYPHTLLLPDSRLLVPASTEESIVSQVLNLNTTPPSWTSIGGTAVDGGSSVMYIPRPFDPANPTNPAIIFKTGTSNDTDNDAGGRTRTSASTAYVLDTTQPSPAWTPAAPMRFGRTYHCTTVLPDGNLLVTGGGSTTYPTTDFSTPAENPELWSPITQTWTTLAPMSRPRLYHGVALLLPDARVLVSGGGRWPTSSQVTDELNAEFFAPPYLFNGPRPVIASAPSQLSYGQNFTVQTPDAARIAKVSLIRFGAVTHDFNTGQHFIPLAFTPGAGLLTVTAPPNSNWAPPGNYMLFLVDTNGVPSVAALTHF